MQATSLSFPVDFWQFTLSHPLPYSVWGDYVRLVGEQKVVPPVIQCWSDLRELRRTTLAALDKHEVRAAWNRYVKATITRSDKLPPTTRFRRQARPRQSANW